MPDRGLAKASPVENDPERLLHILRPQNRQVKLELPVVRLLRNDAYSQPRNDCLPNLLHSTPSPRFVRLVDGVLGRKIMLAQPTCNTSVMALQGEASEVPMFLIRLKAACAGLNLTSADTVIYYDPWREFIPI